MRLALLLILGSLLFPGLLSANMAEPYDPGSPVGEPTPNLDSIRVLHEDLVLDMRGVDRRESAHVRATYRVMNDGAAKRLELIFIAGQLFDSSHTFAITIDGRSVPGSIVDSIGGPVEWNLPGYTPGFGRSDSLDYRVLYEYTEEYGGELEEVGPANERPVRFAATTRGIRFSIDMPEGEHTITVEYDADAAGNGWHRPVYIWQLGYVLSPVRTWAGFGGLNATVLVPEGWEAAVLPEMERRGDSLVGSWDELPADAITVSTRTVVSGTMLGMADWVPYLLAILIILLFSVRLGVRHGKRIAERNGKLTSVVPYMLLSMVTSYLLFSAAAIASTMWAAQVLGNQGVPGYSDSIYVVLLPLLYVLSPLILVILIPPVIVLLAAARTVRASRN